MAQCQRLRVTIFVQYGVAIAACVICPHRAHIPALHGRPIHTQAPAHCGVTSVFWTAIMCGVGGSSWRQHCRPFQPHVSEAEPCLFLASAVASVEAQPMLAVGFTVLQHRRTLPGLGTTRPQQRTLAADGLGAVQLPRKVMRALATTWRAWATTGGWRS